MGLISNLMLPTAQSCDHPQRVVVKIVIYHEPKSGTGHNERKKNITYAFFFYVLDTWRVPALVLEVFLADWYLVWDRSVVIGIF